MRTEKFKNWFGDWENDPQNSSKVVDENGEPLVVYHGTNDGGFTVFNENSRGIFFSSIDRASWYVTDEYSPEVITEFEETETVDEDNPFKVYRNYKAGMYACFLNIRNPRRINARGKWAGNVNQVRNRKKQDGVIVENVVDGTFDEDSKFKDTNYIVFNSNQIKSATNNIGEFSPLDDDIRFSSGKSDNSAKNSVDNSEEKADNEYGTAEEALKGVSGLYFQKRIGLSEMKRVREEVERDMKLEIDFSKIDTGTDLAELRDSLSSIKILLEMSAENRVKNSAVNMTFVSAKLEYARRCFDYDGRIAEITVRQMDEYERQRGVRDVGTSTVSRRDTRGNGINVRQNTQRYKSNGIHREVAGEKDDAYKFFKQDFEQFEKDNAGQIEKLKAKMANDTQHSEKNQGAFSFDEKISAALKNDPTFKNLITELGGKFVNGKVQASAEVKKKIESLLDGKGNLKKSIAWHGTPHDFENFSLDKIGTGEGAQVHGWGLYFSINKSVAETYKKMFGNDGKIFKVEIPDADFLLDEQKTLAKQPEKVQQALRKIYNERGIGFTKRFTGEKIYKELSKELGSDENASKLLNAYDIKGIVYEYGTGGTNYVVFDDKAIKILEKYSLQGTGDTSIKNFVADEKLNSQQKLLKDFGKKMGVNVIYFENDNADFHGAYSDGIVFLNKNSKIPLGKVFWHEILHWMSANNPKLFKKLADAANLSEKQLENYLDTTGRRDLKSNAEITEEILADSLHKVLDKVHDKNLLQKIIAWIQDTLSKFKEMFRNPKGDLKTAQYNRIVNAFSDIAKTLTDENGNKIFRFNKRTKKLELADGHQLPKIDLRFDDSEKFIDNEADMSENTENEIFDKYLNPKIKKDVEKFAKDIADDVDWSKINSIADLRDVRDKLKYLRSLNNGFRLKRMTDRQRKVLATWIEYTRRRFENDDRIRERLAVQIYDSSYGRQQSGVYQGGERTLSELDNKRIRRRLRESHGTAERYVTAEHIESHNEFLKLYNEQARFNGEPEIKIYPRNEEKHSVQTRGVFNLDNETVVKNLGGKLENGEWIFDNEKNKRDFEKFSQK